MGVFIDRRVTIVASLLFSLPSLITTRNASASQQLRVLEGYDTFDVYGQGDGDVGDPTVAPVAYKGNEPADDSYGGLGRNYGIVATPSNSSAEGDGIVGSSGNSGGSGNTFAGNPSTSSVASGSSSYGSGSYSGSSTYSDSSGYSGTSSYSSNSAYGGSSTQTSKGSYSQTGGSTGSYRPPSELTNDLNSLLKKVDVKVPLIPVVIVAVVVSAILCCCGMVWTAFMYQARRDSKFTKCCRLCVHCIRSACAIACNLYHCRLGDIPPIVCALEDDDDLNDEELARMKPRPGIQKALQIEHQKAVAKVEDARNPLGKQKQSLRANIFS